MPEKLESEARLPGWTLIRTGHSNRYRSPDGREIGDHQYRRLYREYKRTGVIPSFSPHDTSTRQSFFRRNDNDILESSDTDEVELPTTKVTPASKSKDRYSSKQLSEGYGIVLILVTSGIALATQLPEAQMRENEIKAISVPLANITERSALNITIGNMIVGKSDYAV